MSDEWGPWIEHDGRGCPCVGEYTQDSLADGSICEGVVEHTANAPRQGYYSVWIWATIPSHDFHSRVISYRIRKPKGLTILEGLLEHLPNEVDA